MRRTVLAAAAVVVALTASACASRTSGSDAHSGSGAIVPTSALPNPVPAKNDCSDLSRAIKAGDFAALQPAAGSLPADAHPVALLKCVTDSQGAPGEGVWTVVNTIRSTGSVDGFVNALRAAYVKPPQPTPKHKNYVCSAVGYVEPWVVLIDGDGKAYQIKIPFWGVCPAPNKDVLKALDAVETKVASSERTRQAVSPGAQASGCPQQFTEMAFVSAQGPGPAPETTRPFFALPNANKLLGVCYYKLGSTVEKVKPAGDFEASATLTDGQAAAVYDGLANASVSTGKPCDAPAREYAVLGVGGGTSTSTSTSTSSWSVVELGGCKLAAPHSGPDRQVPDAVIQALLAARK